MDLQVISHFLERKMGAQREMICSRCCKQGTESWGEAKSPALFSHVVWSISWLSHVHKSLVSPSGPRIPGLNKLRHEILLPGQNSIHAPPGCLVPCFEQDSIQAFPVVAQGRDWVGCGTEVARTVVLGIPLHLEALFGKGTLDHTTHHKDGWVMGDLCLVS